MAFILDSEVFEQHTFLHLCSVVNSQGPRARSYSDGDIVVPMTWEEPKVRVPSDCASTTGSWAEDTEESESTCCEMASLNSVCDEEPALLEESVPGQFVPAMMVPNKAQCVMPLCFATVELRSEQTTVMLRNLPNKMTRTDLVKLIDSKGFAGHYDFIYVPIDFKTRGSFGYGLVNMLNGAAARQLMNAFEGFADWASDSRKVCKVEWARRQGLLALLQHYRESKIMHEAVPDEYRPATFFEGQQVALPAPSSKLRQPNLKERKSRKSRQQAAYAA